MYRKRLLSYQKIKAAVLLLCLYFMMVGTCPLQKFLLSTFPIKVELSSQPRMSKTVVNNNLTCSANKEVVKTPMVELTKKSNNNTLSFLLLSTFAYLFAFSLARNFIPILNRETTWAPAVPLFLRNQVFII